MKNFDQKWQTLAARARQAAPPDETPPAGFVTRATASPPTPRETIWAPLALRAVWGAAAALAICAVLDAPYLRKANLFDCGVDDFMTRVIWAL